MPENFPPQKLPEPWLIDSEYLLEQLARIRELALKVPFTNESYQPTNTVVDAIWRLEEQLRYVLHLHREGQRSFAAKTESTWTDEKARTAQLDLVAAVRQSHPAVLSSRSRGAAKINAAPVKRAGAHRRLA